MAFTLEQLKNPGTDPTSIDKVNYSIIDALKTTGQEFAQKYPDQTNFTDLITNFGGNINSLKTKFNQYLTGTLDPAHPQEFKDYLASVQGKLVNGQTNSTPQQYSVTDPNKTTGTLNDITSSNGMSPTTLVNTIQNQTTPQPFSLTAGNLQVGSSGANVSQLQTLLGITADGDFGPQTKQAVMDFQRKNGLTVDGIVGPQTSAALTKLGQTNIQTPKITTTSTPVGTSTPARTVEQEKQAQIAQNKIELEQGLVKPTPFDSLAKLDELRQTQGAVKDTEELNTIQDAMRQAQEELNQLKQTTGKEIGMGGFTGNISEAERNMNFRMESLALREQAVVSRLNAKNAYINQALQAGQQTYQNAQATYETEYNKNVKAIDIYNTELDEEKKDALIGFQTISNLLLESGMQLTPQLSQQLDSYALKAGLPIGVFQQALSGLQAKEKIDNMKIVGNNVYMQTTDSAGNPHLKLVQSLPGNGGGGLTPAQINSTVNSIAGAFDNEQIVKDYNAVTGNVDMMKNIGVNSNNPGDDIAFVYAFAKIMDPNSVVREGEYATIQKYAQSFLTAKELNAIRLVKNDSFLSKDAKEKLLTAANAKAKVIKSQYDNLSNEYQRQIDDVYAGKPRQITNYRQENNQDTVSSDWMTDYNYDQDIQWAKEAISAGADKAQVESLLKQKYLQVDL